ncbi:hypothetical protein BLNAU_19402 [Blattamonas nauphoetae]|uniref:Uncharacterized protein n=1 Tax=Blattamonas nauphoetae TaxID=2049346 RepID=A0ABQ9X1L5_9EUKA|nr:hypothetical protein BLNAU_19402 [Blattamonas nauphoetae]
MDSQCSSQLEAWDQTSHDSLEVMRHLSRDQIKSIIQRRRTLITRLLVILHKPSDLDIVDGKEHREEFLVGEHLIAPFRRYQSSAWALCLEIRRSDEILEELESERSSFNIDATINRLISRWNHTRRQNRYTAVGTKNELSISILKQHTILMTSLLQLGCTSSIVSVIVDLHLLQHERKPDIVSRSSVGGTSLGPSEQLEEAFQSGGHR